MCIAFNLPAPLGLCWHKWTKPAPSCMNRALQIINACMPFSLIFKRQFPPCLCAVSRPIRSKKDFSRLVLDVSSLGTSGFVLCEQLAEMGIWVEMADARHLVLICTPKIRRRAFSALENALSAFSANGANAPVPPSIPKRSGEIIAPASVEYDTIRTISVSQSVGCISARAVCCYPPGTAVLCPGERITSEQAAYLEGMHRLGASISGSVPAEDSSLSALCCRFSRTCVK